MTMAARFIGRFHSGLDRHAGTQPPGQFLPAIDEDQHADALGHFHEIAGRIVRLEHGEFRAGRRGKPRHVAVQLRAAERIDAEGCALADGNAMGLRFLVVRHDPQVRRHQREKQRAGRDELAEMHADFAQLPVFLRDDHCMPQVDLGEAERGAGGIDLRLQAAPPDIDGADILARDLPRGDCLAHLRLGRAQGGERLVIFAPGNRAVLHQIVGAGHVRLGLEQLGLRPAQPCGLRGDVCGPCRMRLLAVGQLGLLRLEIGAGLRDAGAVDGIVDANEHLALADGLEVADQHFAHIAADLRRDDRHAAVDIGIVGRFHAARNGGRCQAASTASKAIVASTTAMMMTAGWRGLGRQ